MSTSIAFRYAIHNDIPAIVDLVESAYRGDASRAGWTTEADFLDGQRIDAQSVQADIENPDSLIVLACCSAASTASTGSSTSLAVGEILACCHLQKKQSACYFGMFSVDPTQQGNGLGKQLMTEAERIAKYDWHCTHMEMKVIDIRDELIDFYLRRGYLRTGKHLPFPYGDERFGIPLRDDLRFEILEKLLGD
jgi:ribosomal protein S18 acetylase RimI-like enzyme